MVSSAPPRLSARSGGLNGRVDTLNGCPILRLGSKRTRRVRREPRVSIYPQRTENSALLRQGSTGTGTRSSTTVKMVTDQLPAFVPMVLVAEGGTTLPTSKTPFLSLLARSPRRRRIRRIGGRGQKMRTLSTSRLLQGRSRRNEGQLSIPTRTPGEAAQRPNSLRMLRVVFMATLDEPPLLQRQRMVEETRTISSHMSSKARCFIRMIPNGMYYVAVHLSLRPSSPTHAVLIL